ncbi:MAG: hypothetical protein HOC78_03565 [Candidatus Komeilibacteria bacterium]|jgi:hypothetical protein|nr:hypothetical protein [Candidatus Komeilibacteria bacterium]
MKLIQLNALPEEVQDFIWGIMSDFNYTLFNDPSLNFTQFEFINTLQDDIILKKKNILDLPKELEKMPGKFQGDFRELALKIAIEIFWPLQDYLGGVDRLILRLGGKVPKLVPLKKKASKNKDFLGDTFQGKVKDLISQHKEFKGLQLTPDKIFNKKGSLINPSVQNWIDDYIHFLGAGKHSSLERAKYISKSPNSLKLDDKYKDSLRFLLLSYDQGVELYFDKSEKLLVIKDQPARKLLNKEIKDDKLGFDNILIDFKKDLRSLQEGLFPSDIIMSEAEGDINKVRDILWQSIGMGDKDKVMGCLALLISRKSFDSMIKKDSRFKSILKRFIGIKYGQGMEVSWDENMDQLISRRFFLEMLLVDKLALDEKSLFVTIFYMTNIIPDSGQLIYFDKQDQKFKWRAIQVTGNKFAWVDSL